MNGCLSMDTRQTVYHVVSHCWRRPPGKPFTLSLATVWKNLHWATFYWMMLPTLCLGWFVHCSDHPMTLMMMLFLVCRDFFGMSSDFPLNQLMTRGDEKTSLFYVSPTLRQLIECNQSTVNVSVIILFIIKIVHKVHKNDAQLSSR